MPGPLTGHVFTPVILFFIPVILNKVKKLCHSNAES